jgi:uncharacterized Zn finger protein
MEQMKFLVQGSAPEPYEVKFIKEGNNLSALCTCPAGVNGLYCKHRFNIMMGLDIGIVSQNKDDAKRIKTWLAGTDVEKALCDVAEKEEILERAKQSLSQAKKKLAQSLRD